MSAQLQKQLLPFSLPVSVVELRSLARRQPAKAVAAAVGVGLLIQLLPVRLIVGRITTVVAAFTRPALFSLGLVKAAELCCKNCQIPCSP
jgi:hypothetical protein